MQGNSRDAPKHGKEQGRGGLGGWPMGWDLCRPQLVSSDSLPRPGKGAGMWELDNICPESQKHPVSNSVSHRVTGDSSRTTALRDAGLGWAKEKRTALPFCRRGEWRPRTAEGKQMGLDKDRQQARAEWRRWMIPRARTFRGAPPLSN